MKKIYLIRKGVTLNQLRDLINFLNNYNNGQYFKVVFNEQGNLSEVKKLIQTCDFVFLFIGSNSLYSDKYIEEEILLASRIPSRCSVFTLDEENYPVGAPKGIPLAWKMIVGTVLKATKSNILYRTHKIGFIYP